MRAKCRSWVSYDPMCEHKNFYFFLKKLFFILRGEMPIMSVVWSNVWTQKFFFYFLFFIFFEDKSLFMRVVCSQVQPHFLEKSFHLVYFYTNRAGILELMGFTIVCGDGEMLARTDCAISVNLSTMVLVFVSMLSVAFSCDFAFSTALSSYDATMATMINTNVSHSTRGMANPTAKKRHGEEMKTHCTT